MKHLLISICSVAIALSSLASGLSAQSFSMDDLQARVLATIEKVSPAVVSIGIRGGEFSGVIVSSEGHVLTAGHAATPGQSYRVLLPDGRRFSARGMGSSEVLDCGLIQINNGSNLPFAEMGNSLRLTPNQPCLSISYPAGQELRGKPVIRFGRIVRARNGEGMVQSTALMEPGDSGGPLFDLNGQVIAIHSRIGRSMDRNYDIPVETFRKYWSSLNRAEEFGVSPGRTLPKLGFFAEEPESGDGLVVTRLTRGGTAETAGLKVDDLLTEIQGTRITSIREMRKALETAKSKRVKEIKVTVKRIEARKVLTFPFQTTEIEPAVAPAFSNTPNPQPIPELADFPRQFSELESKLDDQCATVTSTIDNEQKKIVAMRLSNSTDLISKNSRIGQAPHLTIDGKRIDLTVIARDEENDLVLLRAPLQNRAGVKLQTQGKPSSYVGRFLLTPDPDGPGKVSIWSSPEFVSRKVESRGYLGVLPSDHQGGGAKLDEVNAGAARKAGLKAGDVIKKLNETDISTSNDLRRFLAGFDPNYTVKALVLRGDEEIEKVITLGSAPSNSNHTADMMAKSGRRDGFSRVFSHDADLKPDECGGPLFDLDGNLVGLNIARHSRVRTYTIPVSQLKQFAERAAKPRN